MLLQKLDGILSLGSDQIEALEDHYELLLRWNRALNLTSIHSEEQTVERHYCESLFLAKHLPQQSLRIVDVGSGAGFPGLPVAIFRPDCSVTLVEAHQRKAVFLREATRRRENVIVLPRRVETISQHFEWAVSRAVGYENLFPALTKMTDCVDLLTGGEAPPEDYGFEWRPPMLLPWGERRYLRRGCLTEAGVSRETARFRFT